MAHYYKAINGAQITQLPEGTNIKNSVWTMDPYLGPNLDRAWIPSHSSSLGPYYLSDGNSVNI